MHKDNESACSIPIFAKNIQVPSTNAVWPKYSICTLVTNINLYQKMIDSFVKAGFITDIAEYLYIDNSISNTFDAYSGINKFLFFAKGQYIIICHQDILLEYDRIEQLEKCISQLNDYDPNWALLGNAGGVNFLKLAIRITDHTFDNARIGGFPAKVQSLDENFILIRKDANLGTSKDICGFHLYGLDLCLLATIRGYTAYVVDFHLNHLGAGEVDNNYHVCKNIIIKKYERAFIGRYYRTTCGRLYLSANSISNCILNHWRVLKLVRKYYHLKRRFIADF